MKKILIFLVFIASTVSVFSQKSIRSYTEIFLDTYNNSVFRTGAMINTGNLKGLYLFGQGTVCEKDWTFSGGASYSFALEDTFFRILGSYSDKKDFYGYFLAMHDFKLPVINVQPTFIVDNNLWASVGVYVPVDISKHVSLGFWGYKTVKEAKIGGITSGSWAFELDIMLTF